MDDDMTLEEFKEEVIYDYTTKWLLKFNEIISSRSSFNCLSYNPRWFTDDYIKIRDYPKTEEVLEYIRNGAINVFNKLYTSLTATIELYRGQLKKYKFDKDFENYYLGFIDHKRDFVIRFIDFIDNFRGYVWKNCEKEISYYKEDDEVTINNLTFLLNCNTCQYNYQRNIIKEFYDFALNFIEKDDPEHFKDENGNAQFFGKTDLFLHLKMYAYDDLECIYNFIKDTTMILFKDVSIIHPLITQSFIHNIGNKFLLDMLRDFIGIYDPGLKKNVLVDNFEIFKRYHIDNKKQKSKKE